MSLIDSKWLKENNYHLFHYEPMGNGKEGVVEVDADTIPTAWIPCSEKSPEKDGQYIITVKYKPVEGYEDIFSEYGEWYDGRWDVVSTHVGEVEKILAWMPLPEPMKG